MNRYVEHAALANPHARSASVRPGAGRSMHIPRATAELPREPLEIKPHPYGVELGILQKILQDRTPAPWARRCRHEFSRVTPKVAEEILQKAVLPSPRASRATR